jgi:molybdopterin synthase sulfur carrier subunit
MPYKRIRLTFLSTMKELAGNDNSSLQIDAQATVEDLLRTLLTKYDDNITSLLFEENKKSVRKDILILINDVDINVLDGLETFLSEDDEVALMPVAHGG